MPLMAERLQALGEGHPQALLAQMGVDQEVPTASSCANACICATKAPTRRWSCLGAIWPNWWPGLRRRIASALPS
jgi:hypothetical protein